MYTFSLQVMTSGCLSNIFEKVTKFFDIHFIDNLKTKFNQRKAVEIILGNRIKKKLSILERQFSSKHARDNSRGYKSSK